MQFELPAVEKPSPYAGGRPVVEHKTVFTKNIDGVDYEITVTTGESRYNPGARFSTRVANKEQPTVSLQPSLDKLVEVVRQRVAAEAERLEDARQARAEKKAAKAKIQPQPALLLDGTPVTVRGRHASRGRIMLITRDGMNEDVSVDGLMAVLDDEQRDQFDRLVARLTAAEAEVKAAESKARRADPSSRQRLDAKPEPVQPITFDPDGGLFYTLYDGSEFTAETTDRLERLLKTHDTRKTYPWVLIEADKYGRGSPEDSVEPLHVDNYGESRLVGRTVADLVDVVVARANHDAAEARLAEFHKAHPFVWPTTR